MKRFYALAFVLGLFFFAYGQQPTEPTSLLSPYPNPATHTAHLSYSLPLAAQHAQLKVYNLIGRQVDQLPLEQSVTDIQLPVQDWMPGVYVLYLVVDGKEITSRKLVIRK
ncbi:MAG: T9SS type A sorting domain-containing protein [Bacteroidota bacterium]